MIKRIASLSSCCLIVEPVRPAALWIFSIHQLSRIGSLVLCGDAFATPSSRRLPSKIHFNNSNSMNLHRRLHG